MFSQPQTPSDAVAFIEAMSDVAMNSGNRETWVKNGALIYFGMRDGNAAMLTIRDHMLGIMEKDEVETTLLNDLSKLMGMVEHTFAVAYLSDPADGRMPEMNENIEVPNNLMSILDAYKSIMTEEGISPANIFVVKDGIGKSLSNGTVYPVHQRGKDTLAYKEIYDNFESKINSNIEKITDDFREKISIPFNDKVADSLSEKSLKVKNETDKYKMSHVLDEVLKYNGDFDPEEFIGGIEYAPEYVFSYIVEGCASVKKAKNVDLRVASSSWYQDLLDWEKIIVAAEHDPDWNTISSLMESINKSIGYSHGTSAAVLFALIAWIRSFTDDKGDGFALYALMMSTLHDTENKMAKHVDLLKNYIPRGDGNTHPWSI